MRRKQERPWPNGSLFWLSLAIAFFVLGIFAAKVNPMSTDVHPTWGYDLDSVYWIHLQNSVRVDSSTKITDVTEWPDTIFDLALGSRHTIRFYYWAYGFDSAIWPHDYNYYDYNNANCVGGGDYTVRIWVLDTAGGDTTPVDAAKVTITQDSTTGAVKTWWPTGVDGTVEFALDNGDWSGKAGKTGLAAGTIDFTVASGNHYDTILGYEIATPAPPSIDYATVEGYVFDPSGGKLFGSIVTATRVSGSFGTDTTTTPVIIGGKSIVASVDTAGYFSMFLMRTTAYDDTTTGKYNIFGTLPSGTAIFKILDVRIPASGNVNLGQIHARRP